jgi:class 3 adenylate cyclase
VLSPDTLIILGNQVRVAEWREDSISGHNFGTLAGLDTRVPRRGWPVLPLETTEIDTLRPWLLPPVFERLHLGLGEFLADFRPVVTLFLRFSGIEYDQDEKAGVKLDAYIRWVQAVITRYDGNLIQLTIGDKGSYLCAAFGAPIVHEDDSVRAVSAALELRNPPPELAFAGRNQIGLAQGVMRAGAYGSPARRTYGVMSDEINLSARLMQAAAPGQILASQETSDATAGQYLWESLPDMRLKGKAEPVAVSSLVGPVLQHKSRFQSIEYSLPWSGAGRSWSASGRSWRWQLAGRAS